MECGNFFPLCVRAPKACRARVTSIVDCTAGAEGYRSLPTQGGCAAIESCDQSPHSIHPSPASTYSRGVRTPARSPHHWMSLIPPTRETGSEERHTGQGQVASRDYSTFELVDL